MKVAHHPAGAYGVIAEFAEPDDLIEATQDAYDRGYRLMEAYTPFPVHGLPDALGFKHNKIPAVVLIGGIVGGLSGFFMQWYLGDDQLPAERRQAARSIPGRRSSRSPSR